MFIYSCFRLFGQNHFCSSRRGFALKNVTSYCAAVITSKRYWSTLLLQGVPLLFLLFLNTKIRIFKLLNEDNYLIYSYEILILSILYYNNLIY